ncbi:MAG: ABC transporter substrate-binding protein [Rhodobacteraceae bacterium]|nr:ABC transporter substrate-binding protein [Paracoccaceae bacterium]
MHSNDPTRRHVLTGGAALGLTLLAGNAQALSTNQASAFIQQVVDQTMGIVNSSASTDQALSQFEQVLARYGDMPVVARAVLGQPWRSASGSQQQAFVQAFQGYLARKYGREFREYRGASMRVSGASDQGDKGILVNTVVDLPGRQPFAVDWQVSDRSGATKLINLIIEGVSMLTTERSEVRAIYESNRSNLDATIQDLRQRG